MDTKKLLQYNRNPELSPWFQERLEELVEDGVYHTDIDKLRDGIVDSLQKYRDDYNLKNVVIE